MPFALDVLTLRGDRIADVTAFIARSARPRPAAELRDLPDTPGDEARVDAFFARFGLPTRIEA